MSDETTCACGDPALRPAWIHTPDNGEGLRGGEYRGGPMEYRDTGGPMVGLGDTPSTASDVATWRRRAEQLASAARARSRPGRAVVANCEGATGPDATMTRRVINLVAALSAADGAM